MSETPPSNPTPNPTEASPPESKVAVLKAQIGAQVEVQVGKLKEVRGAVVESLRSPVQFLSQVMKEVRSPDAQTRRMAWLYLLALGGILAMFGMGVVQLVKYQQVAFKKDAESQSENFAKLIEKQRQSAEFRHTQLRLGSFGIAMNDIPGSKRLSGVVAMAEIEIFVQCDKKSTCDYLEENLVRAKDVITQVLSPMDREDLLSSDGKERLKSAVMDALNQWLPNGGGVKKVFFSRVLID